MTIYCVQTWRNASAERDLASTMKLSLKKKPILEILLCGKSQEIIEMLDEVFGAQRKLR